MSEVDRAAATDPGIDLSALIGAEIHELKNRLGQLTLNLDELAGADEGMADALREPRNTCQRIGESLVQILTLYKGEKAQISLNVEAHNPAAFVEELQADAETLAGKGIQIEGRVDAAPPFWFFDRYLVAIAMASAIHNAIKFARKRIVIGAVAEHGGLSFFVQDDSAGFPPEILIHQGRAPGRSATGTGLGLYFAHALAKAHVNKERSGEVRLENRDGAYFSLWLP